MATANLGLAIVATLAASVIAISGAKAAPITVPVTCGGNQVGAITADISANGAGITGGFASSVGGPPATLAAAAAGCGEDHFNWYQIVTADNMPPKDARGNQIPVPPPAYVDPPPGGYIDQWADNLPWYWDEYRPPARTPNFDPDLLLSANTTNDTLKFADFPGGAAGTNLSFKTWLVSLNADSSFDSFHCGFSWSWSNATGSDVAGQPLALGACSPTAAEYQDITGGFATRILEPSSFALLSFGVLVSLAARRRRSAQTDVLGS